MSTHSRDTIALSAIAALSIMMVLYADLNPGDLFFAIFGR
jgi:hypothetical protein